MSQTNDLQARAETFADLSIKFIDGLPNARISSTEPLEPLLAEAVEL